jgi:biopolymer transport protein ExbD
MTIRSAYQKAINWYMELPWYWQLLCFVPLIAILLLGLLSVFTKAPVMETNPKVDTALKDLKASEKELQKAIVAKQKIIAIKLNAADVEDTQAVARLRTLMEVHTMEELDALQKEWDL